jgi:hypothetical protein
VEMPTRWRPVKPANFCAHTAPSYWRKLVTA